MGRLALGILASLLAMARRREDVARDLEDAARRTKDPDARAQLLRGATMLRLHGWTEQAMAEAINEARR